MFKNIVLVIILAFPVSIIAQGIHFEDLSLEEALKKAKMEDKTVFIDGYATWCGPCKLMEKTVFKEQEVGDYFREHFIALKVDVERGEGPQIKSKYGITGLPGYVFIDGNDEVVYRFAESMSTEEFLDECKKAHGFASSPNSLGRMAEKYESEKDNESFLKNYLKVLKDANATDYYDILEHFLAIQTSIPEESKEMVMLLADHYQLLIFGGKAEKIINDNLYSDAWNQYVRKDIREIYQKIPKSMVMATTEYAIARKDSTILELTMEKAAEIGVNVDKAQRKRSYIYFYLKSGQGEKYKALVRPDHEAFVNGIDVEDTRSFYLDWLKRKAEGDPEALRLHPYAERWSTQIAQMVEDYSKFVQTERDKADVQRWMKVAYDIIPYDPIIMSTYANVLYMYGDKDKALEIKEEAFELAQKEDLKRASGILADLEMMKEGDEITLY
ncbi:thioredoxin family protein [Robertkochia solimangrovi]|uniref:thioredoxin family protein n=1 Tax=Robertkochia solimangrovi TaxID=2213046 RepID=UPI0013A588BA|nr:thioredoxin family protein [Robertkochia solimangrovi]